jgi:hypothetical protein
VYISTDCSVAEGDVEPLPLEAVALGNVINPPTALPLV